MDFINTVRIYIPNDRLLKIINNPIPKIIKLKKINTLFSETST